MADVTIIFLFLSNHILAEMSYYYPENTFVVNTAGEKVLNVPKEQTRKVGDKIYFSYLYKGVSRIDNPLDISKLEVISLKSLAYLLEIPGYYKMRKKDLIDAIAPRVVIET